MEVFENSPAGTVTSGGTDAPAGGTVETWTVTVTAAFAEANASATPPTWFHGADPAAPSEVFLVTANPGGTGTGQSWTVTRGAEGTTPVTHATGFSITQVTSAGFLGSLLNVPWNYIGTGSNPAFGSGWSNVGSGNDELAFRAIGTPWDKVEIKGYVANGTGSNTAAIFTLPAAYRPASQQIFTCTENPGSPVMVTVVVQTNGQVKTFNAAGAGDYVIDIDFSLSI
jgi:hypothetical protein